MSERITHEGIIDHIENDTVFVRILSKSACAECHSKGLCSVSEMTEKLVEVRGSSFDYTPGQEVNVVLDQTSGNKAVVLGYLIPFILLIVTLLVVSAFFSELWAGLSAIAILFPYYLMLFVFKHKLRKTFSFRIEGF
jgi:sigma-E factor negative regulatory protein RseC